MPVFFRSTGGYFREFLSVKGIVRGVLVDETVNHKMYTIFWKKRSTLPGRKSKNLAPYFYQKFFVKEENGKKYFTGTGTALGWKTLLDVKQVYAKIKPYLVEK